MLKPLSVQLYSLRDAASKDFVSVLKWVAKVGYKGVEPAGFWDLRPSEFKKMIEDLGLKMYSSHSPWARSGNLGETMEIASILGLNKIQRIDGKLKYEIYRELCPKVKYQIDCFWSTNLGAEDPVEMLKLFARDTILLHMKDGTVKQKVDGKKMVNGILDREVNLLPLGTGELPIKQLIAAMPEQVETITVELDYCNIDMFTALEQSYRYMTENGLAAGNK